MDIMPAVSIIVPIYNAEKYLERCIGSLVGQTLRNIEIVLVDDGSLDSSGSMAEHLSRKDERIRLARKENGGLSSARNAGIELARGEYLGFVDADDWVSEGMFELLYQSALRFNSDIVMTGSSRVRPNRIHRDEIKLEKEYYSGRQEIDGVLSRMTGSDPRAEGDIDLEMCVTKNIYRRQLVNDNRIRFRSEKVYISEDILFNMEALKVTESISVVHDCLYFYRYSPSSLTQAYRNDRFERECALFEFLEQRLRDWELYENCALRLQRTFIGRARRCIIGEARDSKASSLQRLRNIKSILESPILKRVLSSYPVCCLPAKLGLMACLMKYRMSVPLFLICSRHTTP